MPSKVPRQLPALPVRILSSTTICLWPAVKRQVVTDEQRVCPLEHRGGLSSVAPASSARRSSLRNAPDDLVGGHCGGSCSTQASHLSASTRTWSDLMSSRL